MNKPLALVALLLSCAAPAGALAQTFVHPVVVLPPPPPPPPPPIFIPVVPAPVPTYLPYIPPALPPALPLEAVPSAD